MTYLLDFNSVIIMLDTEVDLDRSTVGEVLAWMKENDCEEFSFDKTRELKETQTFWVSKEELLSLDKNTDFYEVDKDWEGKLDGNNWDYLGMDDGNESEEYMSHPEITKTGGE
jgi:hypothetical protein